MEIQFCVDGSGYSDIDLEEIATPIISDMSNWLGNKSAFALLDERGSDCAEDWRLGLSMRIKSKFKLKDPLNFLYELSKKYKCEFAVAIFDSDSASLEEVCYFGYEEGRPDLYEIANYLGL